MDVNGPACPAPNIVSIAGMELHSSPILDTFFKFVVERHAIHQRRLAGQPPPWTTNDVMAKYPFTNVFRVFDRGSQYVLHNVINVGDQSLTEQCFRVMLFRAFNKEETWEYMEERLGGVTWRNFDLQAYEEILVERNRQGYPLYNPAYIIPSPKLGGLTSPANHLRLIEMMMTEGLPEQLKKLQHLQDAHGRIVLFPGMGDFMALQLLLDLNMTTHFGFSEDEWVALGPGSMECIRKMFGADVRGHELDAVRYLHRTQHQHFARLNVSPGRIPRLAHGMRSGLSMVDIEHALCECEKYSRAAHPSIQGHRQRVSKRRFVPHPEPITAEAPEHWLNNESRRQFVFTDPPPVVVNGVDFYEVSHIVAERKGANAVADPHYRIRWTGYSPEVDTWERRSTLVDCAPLVLADWEVFKERIVVRTLEYQKMGPKQRAETPR